MAETYRGLTIQIGADASQLSKALKSSNSAITQTQSELSKISKGLKFDSSSTALLSDRFKQLQEKSAAVASKLATLKAALNGIDGSKVQSVIEGTSSLALEAGNAQTKYARINDQLAQVYNDLEKIAKANGIAFDRDNIEQSLTALSGLNSETDELISRAKELKEAHQQAFDDVQIKKQALQYQDLLTEINKTEAELKSLVNAQNELRPSCFDKVKASVNSLSEELEQSDKSLAVLSKEFESLNAAIQLSPNGINAVGDAQKNLEQQAKVLQDKYQKISAVMESLPVSKTELAGRTTLEIAEEAQKAETNYKKLASEMATVAGKLSEAKRNADAFESTSGKSSDEYKKTKTEVEKLSAELAELKEKAKQATDAMDSAKAAQEYKELAVQAQNASNEIAELGQKSANLSNTATVSHSAWKSLGMTLYSSISPAVQQLGNFSIEAGDRIDSAFRSMKKTVQGTEQDFQHLRDAALEFSRTNAVSADTILNIEAMGGQLGIAVENLEDFAEVASNLDIATDIDADTIAQDLGQLNGILPDLNDNYEAFGDSLVRLGNNMPAQESAIMDITTRIGSMGGLMGMTTPQILGWASAIAATGQNSESAGTAISNTMSDIESAVANGGDKLQQFANIAGVSAQEFKNKWDNDASGALQIFVEGLKKIDEAGGSVDATLEGLGITGVRQKQALEGLTQTTNVLSDALTMSEDAWNGVSDQWGAAGDAAREASQKSEGFSGALQILKNSADELGSEIAEALVPFIQAATKALQALTDIFSGLPEPVKDATIMFGLAAAAAGTLVTAMVSIKGVVGDFKAKATAAAAATKLLSATQTSAATSAKVLAVNESTAATGAKTLGVQTQAASVKMKAMNAATAASAQAMKLLKVAAGVGAVVALSALVEIVQSAIERQQQLQKATTGLTDSVNSLAKMAPNATSEVSNLGITADGAATGINSLVEAHAAMADEIADNASSAADSVNLIERYKNTIVDLAGQSNLTSDQIADLKTSVDGFNDACGTSYTVSQDASGAYQVMADDAAQSADAIEKVASAIQLQAQAQAIADSLESIYAQSAEDAAQYAEQLKRVQEAQEQYTEAQKKAHEGDIAAQQSLDGLNSYLEQEKQKLQELSSVTDSTSSAEKKLEDQQRLISQALEESASANLVFAANSSVLRSALAEAEGSSLSFVDACDKMNLSLEDIDPNVLNELAVSWDGDIVQMIAKAKELGLQVPQEFSKLAASSQTAGEQVATNLANGMASGSVSVDAAAKVLAEYAKGNYQSAIDAASAAGISIPDSLRQGIESGAYSPSEATSRMMSLIAIKLSNGDITAAATALGTDIDAGLAEGIRNGTLSEDEAKILGEDVLAKAKDALDSHSPSRKFEQLGSDVDAGLANGITNNSDSPLGAIGGLISSLIRAASGQLSPAMQNEGSEGSNALASGISGGISLVSSAAQQVADSAKAGIGEVSTSYSSTGTNASSLFASGIGSARTAALNAASSLAKSATNGVSGTSTELTSQGSTASKGFASGVGNRGALSSTQAAANSLSAAAKRMSQGDYFTSGSHLVSNFASGIRAGISWVSSAAASVAKAAKAALGFSVPKEGVWSGAERGGERSGMHLAQNWAAGLTKGQKVVKAAANELMKETQAELSTTAVTPTIKVNALVEDLTLADGVDLAATAAETSALVSEVAATAGLAAVGAIANTTNTTNNNQRTINQNFQTKVVRSDADMYSASTIINRSALRAATKV